MAVVRRGDPVTVWKYYQPQRLSGKPEGGLPIAAIRGLARIALCNQLLSWSLTLGIRQTCNLGHLAMFAGSLVNYLTGLLFSIVFNFQLLERIHRCLESQPLRSLLLLLLCT